MPRQAYSDPTAWMAIGRVMREEKRKRRRQNGRELPGAERRDRNADHKEMTNKEAEQK